MWAAFSHTGASCYLSGQLTKAGCTRGGGAGLHQAQALPTLTTQRQPQPPTDPPCPSPTSRRRPFSLPQRSPALLRPLIRIPGPFPSQPSLPLVVSSCRRNPGNHHSHILCPQFSPGPDSHTVQLDLEFPCLCPIRNTSSPIHFWECRLAREGGLFLSLIIDLSSLNKAGGGAAY